MRLIALLISVTVLATAQAADIFADPSNLEVLPEDITPAELRAQMRSFAMGTGSRCEDCHVGEAGAPLDTFDFASDEKARKQTAREMIRMTAAINEQFIDALDQPRTTVTCMTCHRGVRKPRTTVEELEIAAASGDSMAGLTRYKELRERYYGSHSYDFTEQVLLQYGQRVAAKDPAAAASIVEANLAYFPESLLTWVTLAQVRSAGGNSDGARDAFGQALELAPDERTRAWVQSQLDALTE